MAVDMARNMGQGTAIFHFTFGIKTRYSSQRLTETLPTLTDSLRICYRYRRRWSL